MISRGFEKNICNFAVALEKGTLCDSATVPAAVSPA